MAFLTLYMRSVKRKVPNSLSRYTKRRMGAHGLVHPSFGMDPSCTQQLFKCEILRESYVISLPGTYTSGSRISANPSDPVVEDRNVMHIFAAVESLFPNTESSAYDGWD